MVVYITRVLYSGGKDSCYNMMKCVSAGHEIVALANLQPSEQGPFISSEH